MTSKGDDISNWETENLRLTAFTNTQIRPESITWWHDLFNESPDSSLSRPKQGVRKDEGPFQDGILVLNSQPGRIDWRYNWKPEENSEGLPVIGSFDKYLEIFSGIMKEWLTKAPPIIRLAFGAVLLKEVGSRQDGYIELNRYLPSVELDPEEAFDFLYQINRRRNSQVIIENALPINRLSKWSMVRLRRLVVNIGDDQSARTAMAGEDVYACRLELDISTNQDYSENFPREKLNEIFSELIEMGKEIVLEGDIK